jgi:predicted metal-dependent peptidase
VTFPWKLQAARLRLVQKRPFLATAVWALKPVERAGLQTMAVDKHWRLYYDPLILDNWAPETLAGSLYHQICHLLRNHAERLKAFDPQISNLAADAEINDDLLREGVEFPYPPLTPVSIGQPENLLAEEYYVYLEGQKGSTENQKDKKEASTVTGAKNQFPRPGSGWCGSCATGIEAHWEEKGPQKECQTAISKMEGELIRHQVAREINEHLKSQGSVPGHWIRWAKEKLHPQVDWRKQLAATLRSAVADTTGVRDYSYSRPARRQGRVRMGDVIFPALRAPVPPVAIIADTSASVTEKMLSQTLAEIGSILKILGSKEQVQVLAVDKTVQFCKQIFRPEQVELIGGGGTDLRIGFEALTKLKPRVQLGIVITDGHTPWPERPPWGMKVIVVLSGDGKTPEWAKVIKVNSSGTTKGF